MSRWTKKRPPARDGDRYMLRMAAPKMEKGKRRKLSKPYLMEVKNGKPHFVLTKAVEFLSIASPFRPDLGDVWKPLK